MATKFVDVAKQAKDLLSKNYNYNTKVELTNNTPNGVQIVSEAVISKPSSALVKGSWSSGNFKVDKLQIGSDKKVVGEFSMANAVPNTSLSFKVSDGTRAAGADAVTAVLGVTRVDKSSYLTMDLDALKTTADSSLTFNYDGFIVGGQVKAGLKDSKPEVTDYNVLLGYKDKSVTAAVVTDRKLSGVSASVYSAVNATTSFGAVAKFPLAMKTASAFDLEAGLAYKAAADTTIHAKASSAGKVAVSYKQALNSMATLTLAGEVDAANLGSDDHKFGINLALVA